MANGNAALLTLDSPSAFVCAPAGKGDADPSDLETKIGVAVAAGVIAIAMAADDYATKHTRTRARDRGDVRDPASDPGRDTGLWLSYAPVTRHVFVVGQDHSKLRLLVCRALAADAKYRRDAPAGWPPLPICREDIKAAIKADDNPWLNVVGHFGSSLRSDDWRADHPGLAEFASGLMSYRHTPDQIRNDPELRRLFPPVGLKGLSAEWCSGL